jgi:PhnB protein
MNNKVSFIPEGYHTVTPYLVVHNAEGLVDFMKQVFGAVEKERILRPDGTIVHAEMRIGDSIVMMAEASGNDAAMPGMLFIYLENVDEAYHRAMAAGASSVRAPRDEYYGDRTAGVNDTYGNQWWMATHIEDVPAEELQRRLQAQQQSQT